MFYYKVLGARTHTLGHTDKPDIFLKILEITVIYPVGNKTHGKPQQKIFFYKCDDAVSTSPNSTNQIAFTYELSIFHCFLYFREPQENCFGAEISQVWVL